jgi:hypothetical protein
MPPRRSPAGYWVLKGAAREFYVCAAAGRDPRVALCLFGNRFKAEEHLRSLGVPGAFLETLERYGASMPGWMCREPEQPGACWLPVEELLGVVRGLELGHVVLDPPPAGARSESFEPLPAGPFLRRRAG